MRKLTDALRNTIKGIKLVGMDVDGVLTDGGMYYSESGDEIKKFHSRDGMGIKLLQGEGIITAFVTSEKTSLVQRRGDRLKVPEIHQGTFEKTKVLQTLCAKYNLQMSQVAYIGDDVNDLDALQHVGFSLAPADAVSVIKEVVDYICDAGGGAGAVREVCDLILQIQKV